MQELRKKNALVTPVLDVHRFAEDGSTVSEVTAPEGGLVQVFPVRGRRVGCIFVMIASGPAPRGVPRSLWLEDGLSGPAGNRQQPAVNRQQPAVDRHFPVNAVHSALTAPHFF